MLTPGTVDDRKPVPQMVRKLFGKLFADKGYISQKLLEMSLRFTKSEMAFEAPRLQAWEARLKFLLIASLAYAFLLSFLANMDFLFSCISRHCHISGKWSRDISAPLYRLRLAPSSLWLDFRPHTLPSLNSE